MKKIYFLLSFIFLSLSSCTSDDIGPPGPPGPQGPEGEPGVNILGQTFEIEAIDFQYFQDTGTHEVIIGIPSEIEVLDSDAILVYRLEISDGVEAWSLIPQNYFLNQGIIQYVYNHTVNDVQIIIDGDFDLSTLSTDFTQDQIFRFVVVPSNFATTTGVDVSNFNAVMSALRIQESEIPQLELK